MAFISGMFSDHPPQHHQQQEQQQQQSSSSSGPSNPAGFVSAPHNSRPRARAYAVAPQMSPFGFNPRAGDILPDRITSLPSPQRIKEHLAERQRREEYENRGGGGGRGASPPGERPPVLFRRRDLRQEQMVAHALPPPPPGPGEEPLAPKWLQNFPHSSEEKRFRPSETWSAISPNFPPMDTVLGSYVRAQKEHYEQQQQQQQLSRSGTVLDAHDTSTAARRSASLASLRTSTNATTTPPPIEQQQQQQDEQHQKQNDHHKHNNGHQYVADPNNPFAVIINHSTSSPSDDKRKQGKHHRSAAKDDDDDVDDDDESQEASGALASAARNRLMSLGTTSNPYSQRLFSQFAPEKFSRDAETVQGEAVQQQSAAYNDRTTRRSANNLLPPTPFSQTVPVLTFNGGNGGVPRWHRRLEAARDLEAQLSDADDSDDDRDAIYDEFLQAEVQQAKNEEPRSERRGDFFRLPLQPPENFLKLYDRPPQQPRHQDHAALEYLAVSRPEFAPALRRLAPWQLHLIDWPSLFRGGTHQDVSVTAKQFPHGAAWSPSPFSEAPAQSGGLGFVGNLQKREQEAEFFAKLHPSADGRVDDKELGQWVKRAPIRFTVHDDPV